MVSPGFSFTCAEAVTPSLRVLLDRVGLLLAPGREPCRQRRIVQREHAGREQRGVDGAGLADRQRADRDAGGHLHDRVERIDAGQRLGFDREPRTPEVPSGTPSCPADARRRRRRR